jgi:GTP-binding protein
MFKDEVTIHVRSGRGGDGCVSFRREKFVPKGGPDGGDGGKGGDVVFVVKPSLASLGKFHNNQKLHARNGQPGRGNNCTGRTGEDLVLDVPCGTVIRDAEHGHVLKDLSDSEKPFVFLKGGRGGRGNTRFATPVDQTPKRADDGSPGEERSIILELKMIADVGIIGLPNAGKSTFLSRVSRARPEVADYPFTTLVPQLGVVDVEFERFIFADIPGLIEGAHEGHGLGDRFLRHIERTRILLHLIDVQSLKEPGFAKAHAVILEELKNYSPILAAKPQIVALSKADLLSEAPDLSALAQEIGSPVLLLSSHTGQGIKPVLGALLQTLGSR